jgi:hypothetical protein
MCLAGMFWEAASGLRTLEFKLLRHDHQSDDSSLKTNNLAWRKVPERLDLLEYREQLLD